MDRCTLLVLLAGGGPPGAARPTATSRPSTIRRGSRPCGTLAVQQATAPGRARNGPEIRGLILFSPAIRIVSRVGWPASWHKTYSWAFPKGKWVDLRDEQDGAKYESFPKNAGDQIHLLTTSLGSGPVRVPTFIVLSEDDDTVKSRATLAFFQERLTSPLKRMRLYTRRPDAYAAGPKGEAPSRTGCAAPAREAGGHPGLRAAGGGGPALRTLGGRLARPARSGA
jgi:hypothetical protein